MASTTTTDEKIKLAILDDYAGIAEAAFHKIPSNSKLDITVFNTTISPSTPEGLSQLIQHLFSALPNLKLLCTTGIRNLALDLAAAKAQSVPVVGTLFKDLANPRFPSGYDSTNEQTWALTLGLAKNLVGDDSRVKNGEWQSGLNIALAGKTLGLLGLGKLGTQCAVTGRLGFGMQVIAWSSSLTQQRADEIALSRGLMKGSFRVVGSKRELFERADVVSLHNMLSERSRGIVGREELGVMKKGAILVNTSRGPLIDEVALLEVLNAGNIKGVGLDVHYSEPLPADSEWRSQEWGKNGTGRVLLTSHTGCVEDDTLTSWYEQTAGNVGKWLNGEEVVRRLA